MSDTDVPAVYHVACEACRLRKCKCNKILPICGQCERSGTPCIYPQSLKRGFPEGYLAAIETRLIQTERALFEALSSSVGVSTDELSIQPIDNVFDNKQTKSARMEEWAHFPLNTVAHRQAWYFDKANKLGLNLQKMTQRQGDVSMMEMTSPHSGHRLQGDSNDVLSTNRWHQPYVQSVSSERAHEGLPDQFSTQDSRAISSEPSLTPHWQNQSSAMTQSSSGPVRTTPRDNQATTKADNLSLTQAHRFF